jgi:outer membrane protein TolC
MLSETREIIKNGFAEEQDAEQLALTLNGIENQLKNLQRMEEYNINMLKYVLGIPIEESIMLTDSLNSLLTPENDWTLLNNPFDYTHHIDYKMSENNVEAGKLFTKLEQSKALPSLAAFVNYGVNAYNEQFKFFNSEQKWLGSSVFGLKMIIPIFSSLERTSRVQQAKIGLEKANRNQIETIEKLNLAYQNAKISYENALDTFNNAKESLNLAESIEHKENIKFKEGISGSFELNNAQMQLYGKQQEYLQSIFNLINKKAGLENAMGQ